MGAPEGAICLGPRQHERGFLDAPKASVGCVFAEYIDLSPNDRAIGLGHLDRMSLRVRGAAGELLVYLDAPAGDDGAQVGHVLGEVRPITPSPIGALAVVWRELPVDGLVEGNVAPQQEVLQGSGDGRGRRR